MKQYQFHIEKSREKDSLRSKDMFRDMSNNITYMTNIRQL